MSKEHEANLESLTERCMGLDEDCLDTETKRFAVRQHNGHSEWIGFCDTKAEAISAASQAPSGEIPWCAIEIVDLATGERWTVEGYTARVQLATEVPA
jgi:hypothetical protein